MSDLIALYTQPAYLSAYKANLKIRALYYNESNELKKADYLWPHELEMAQTEGARNNLTEVHDALKPS
jgi:hypothetical protein